jgi:DNA repair exonuclease SbcCD nuclease subunit
MIRFLHAADIHIDSPLIGLGRYEGAPVEHIRNATRKALENLVHLAITEQVKFVLIAGDLYDGDWRDYNTGLFLSKEMAKLRNEGIRVFIITGNHDAESNITKSLRMPENVKIFSTKKPEILLIEEFNIAVHGQGFHQRAVTDNIAAGYPEGLPGCFNIGMLHTSVTGRDGHETYAPCQIETLLSKQYDYWALGHVHKSEILHEDPWIIFPGNIQGRHIRETGPKGCTIVTIDDGKIISVDQRDLDILRWCSCTVSALDADTPDGILERVREEVLKEYDQNPGKTLAVQILVAGSCKAHESLMKDPDQWVSQDTGGCHRLKRWSDMD